MNRKLKAALALLAVLVAVLIPSNPAGAVTVYCNDYVSPVTQTVTWQNGGVSIKDVTSSPINSTAKLYVKPAGGTSTLVATKHDPAGTNVTFTYLISTAAEYSIRSEPDTGQIYHDGNGNPLAACHAPLRNLV